LKLAPLMAAFWLAACSSSPEPGGDTGGAPGQTGGTTHTGGASTGGSSTGGAATGGAATGGKGTGGAASGGATGGAQAGTGGGGGSNNHSGGAGGNAGAGASTTGGKGGAGTTGGNGGGGPATGGAGGGAMGLAGPAVPSAGCGKDPALKNGHLTMQSGGMSRTYWLYIPANYDNKHPYRVVFTFHWNGGSGNSIVNPPDQDHNTDRPYYGLLDSSGDTTIYVAPDGIGAGWANTNDRDVNFTDDMLKAISDGLCIDTARVFTTGFSWGGAMSWKLACVRTDKFRAALLYDAGPVSGNNNAECKKPIPLFQSHGLDDGIFNYTNVGLPILKLFSGLDGCTAMTPPKAPDNGHTCVSFEGCMPSTPVRFCNFGKGENNTHPPGGHYPSPKDPGQTVSWVPGEAWKFITQF
jgi:poly(3-hydroxybutyrate) depolymerase